MKGLFQSERETARKQELTTSSHRTEQARPEISITEGVTPLDVRDQPRSTFVFFDVETTGLYSKDRVLSFAAIRVQTGQLDQANLKLQYIYLIFNPEKKSHPRAAEIHGYDDWTLRHQEKFIDHAPVIHEFLSSANLIVAHNAAFDVAFLNREFSLCGFEAIPTPVWCTMLEWRRRYPGLPSSLDAVCKHYGLGRSGKQHGALEDAWLVMMISLMSRGIYAANFLAGGIPSGPPLNFISPPPLPAEPLPRTRETILGKPMTNKGKKATSGQDAPAMGKTSKPRVAKRPKRLRPSRELAAVVGPDPLSRTEVVSKLWDYIAKHKLQNEANKREILADEKLATIFGKNKVTMFEMDKYLDLHLN